jgi:RNA polymerase sigma-70 factor (ECF subfamily)
MRSHEDAEDLIQDVMFRAFLKIHLFRNQCRFSTWLIAIANNAAVSANRKGKNLSFLSLDDDRKECPGLSRWSVADTRPNPEQNAVRRELLTILQTSIERQPRSHQVLVEECLLNEVRVCDVAMSLGLSTGSAKSRLFRARRRVSLSFERRGLIERPTTKTSRRVEP